MNLTVHHNSEKHTERCKAIATARMIYYTANDASELGLRECSQLLYFVADLIKIKFKIDDKEALFSSEDKNIHCNSEELHKKQQNI